MAMNSTFARSNNQFGASFGATTGGRRSAQQTYGDGNKYQSTITMNFRGQDRKVGGLLGRNPNIEPEAEMIENLQQQIHFMDLERKILKEKVVEDEKNSGIGSLYDDEKTSHQHVYQLKAKYREMKRKFDRSMDQLNDENMEIIGKQFELEEQIKIMQTQNEELTQKIKDYRHDMNKQYEDLQREYQTMKNKRDELQQEQANNQSDHGSESKKHYDNKMYLYKEKQFGEIHDKRHEQQMELTKKIHTDNEKLINDLKKDRDELAQKFKNNKELQGFIDEAKEKQDEIEKITVEIQAMEMKAEGLKTITEELESKKDELIDDVKDARAKNEELKVNIKSKEEILNKKLQQTLQRDKNPDMKELIASEETIKLENEELDKKLQEEKKKRDDFLKQVIELKEKIKVSTDDHDETSKHNDETTKEIEDLKKQIEQRQKEVTDLDEEYKKQSKLSEKESDLNRRYVQENATLKERLRYIEEKLDYTGSVKNLDPFTFKELIKSNDGVNTSVDGFIQRLNQIKDEVNKMEAKKQQY